MMPAVTKTSEAYKPCVMLWPDGRTQQGNVKYTKLQGAESARATLAEGHVAYVTPDVYRSEFSQQQA